MRSSPMRVLTIAATLSAVLLCAVLRVGGARGQIPPPVVCRAGNIQTTIGAPAKAWVAGMAAAGWQYTWDWSISFDCSNGNFTNCDVDTKVGVTLWNPAIQDYGPASWEHRCPMNYKACGSNNVTNLTTKWPPMGGAAPGTIFMMMFAVASHDGTIQDCDDQDFQLAQAQVHQVPPAP